MPPSLTLSSAFQLFEELQELLPRDTEDQSPSQPGLRRRAGSGTPGEASPLASGTSPLLCLLNVLNKKWGAGQGAKGQLQCVTLCTLCKRPPPQFPHP